MWLVVLDCILFLLFDFVECIEGELQDVQVQLCLVWFGVDFCFYLVVVLGGVVEVDLVLSCCVNLDVMLDLFNLLVGGRVIGSVLLVVVYVSIIVVYGMFLLDLVILVMFMWLVLIYGVYKCVCEILLVDVMCCGVFDGCLLCLLGIVVCLCVVLGLVLVFMSELFYVLVVGEFVMLLVGLQVIVWWMLV